MDATYATAFAALGGAALGSLTSYATSRNNLRAQIKDQHRNNSRSRRRDLYKEFIDEASRLYGDALVHDRLDLSGLIGLYSILSKIRVLSSPEVIESATRVTRVITETYNLPNKTPTELEAMIQQGSVDLLQEFSSACREEFELNLAV
jgi:hypothetical protein